MGRRRCSELMALAIAALVACADLSRGQEGLPAAEVLARHNLTRLDRVWVLPLELELRQELSELPKLREKLLAIEREIEQRIEQNRVAWQESQPALLGLKQVLGKLPTSDPQRPVIQKQIEVIEAAAPEPSRLAARSDVRAQVVEWNAHRSGLAAATARLRRELPDVGSRYTELAQDPGVQRALRKTGEGHRLGPQRSYQGDQEKLDDYERLVHTKWNPVYQQSGQWRVTGLIHERSPVTFSWSDASEQPTLITSTAAEAAEIHIPEGAPSESVSLSPGRSTTARRVNLPYLRFGACLLRDVSILVLPPEAEDWGCRIGRGALSEHAVKLEPERLRLWIDRG
jgi:hypothetical protein